MHYLSTSTLPNFAIYVLVDPVSLKLLAAGAKFWALYSFCGEILDFYLILRLIFLVLKVLSHITQLFVIP